MRTPVFLTLGLGLVCSATARDSSANVEVREKLNAETPSLITLYQYFHANPELSFQEKNTAARLADELRQAGYAVTTGVGGHGVVAVLSNGPGPVVLVRSDMDALPVKEQTGLSFASTLTARDDTGNTVPVMHACGHDLHMACLVGTARVLAQIKDRWSGVLVLIGQPAEERGSGARAMLKDGLFARFPRPDFCLALHDSAEFPAGSAATLAGYAMANVDSVDITVRGVGGHGAWPHKTKDPVVLAAEIIIALQTIVSREIKPGEPAVVTVGSIHGGTKHNIIPDEVRLQLTVRSYTDEVRKLTLDAIRRIARGQGLAAGLPEDRLPLVEVSTEFTPATYNDPTLTQRLTTLFRKLIGEQNVFTQMPSMGGEDFSEYGRTPEKIPICMFGIGGVEPRLWVKAQKSDSPLPSLHSALWAPLAEPTLRIGVTTMTAAVLDLMAKQ